MRFPAFRQYLFSHLNAKASHGAALRSAGVGAFTARRLKAKGVDNTHT